MQIAPVIDCLLISPLETIVSPITTAIASVRRAETMPSAAARFGPVQISPAVASAIAQARPTTLYQAPALERPDVQRATTRLALSRRTRMLVAHAASGA